MATSQLTTAHLRGADVHIHSTTGGDELAAALSRTVDGGPFQVAAVEAVGPAEHRCAFRVKQAGTAIGYRNIIDLQHRLTQQFDIVRVERTAGIAG